MSNWLSRPGDQAAYRARKAAKVAATKMAEEAVAKARKEAGGLKRIDLWVPEGSTPLPEVVKDMRKTFNGLKNKKVWDTTDRDLILGWISSCIYELEKVEP